MTASTDGNVRLRAACESLGLMSQAAFAEALTAKADELGIQGLSVNTRTVRRWQSADPPSPNAAHVRALEALFNQPITDLGFTPRRKVTATPPTPPTATFPPANLPPSPPLPQAPTRCHDTITTQTVTDYTTLTDAYRQMYWDVPPTWLQYPLFRHAELGTALLEATLTPEDHNSLATATAIAWITAGRALYFGLFQPTPAKTCFTAALQYAHHAKSPSLAAAALSFMALIQSALHREPVATSQAREQLRMARTFARRDGDVPLGLLNTWLDVVESEIEVSNGNLGRASTLIAQAEQRFRTTGGVRPGWLDWLSAQRLATAKANVVLAQGQITEARMILEHSLNDLGDNKATKYLSSLYCDLASVAAMSHEPDEACRYANLALDGLNGHTYGAIIRKLLAIRESLNDWKALPTIRALDERLNEWNSVIAAVSA